MKIESGAQITPSRAIDLWEWHMDALLASPTYKRKVSALLERADVIPKDCARARVRSGQLSPMDVCVLVAGPTAWPRLRNMLITIREPD